MALPAKAIVKLRPGSVFEALQSCCLAFCNVLLVWLAPGLLLACPWLACLSCLVRSRWPWLAPGLLLACSLLASGLSWLLLACYWLALALFLPLVLACSWLASALLLECSWPAPGMLLGCFLLRAWITLGLGKARSMPGASHTSNTLQNARQQLCKASKTLPGRNFTIAFAGRANTKPPIIKLVARNKINS